MVETGARSGIVTEDRAAKPTPQAPRAPRAGLPAQHAGGWLKLECVLCAESFLLDGSEHWGAPPEEMEVLGRKFLGVHGDADLCPRCVHEVERTGAERIYWRIAHC